MGSPQNASELRQQMLARRRHVPEEERAKKFETIVDTFLRLPEYRGAADIIGYYGKVSSGEFNTVPLLNIIIQGGKRLYLPRCQNSKIDLDLYRVSDLERDVELGAYQIYEPIPSCPKITDLPGGIVLVPGSVFDTRGARYGYGAGYYDTFLKGSPLTKIAFTLECCLMKSAIWTHEHDIFMDIIITEENCYRISPSGRPNSHNL